MSRPLLAAPATLTLALAFAPGASAQMSFDGPVDYLTGSRAYTVEVGDLNGDADPDLAVTNSGDDTVSILLGQHGGTFGPATNAPVAIVDRYDHTRNREAVTVR